MFFFLGFFQASKMPTSWFYLCTAGFKYAILKIFLFVGVRQRQCFCLVIYSQPSNIAISIEMRFFSWAMCASSNSKLNSEGRHHIKSLCLLTVMGITHRIVNYKHLQFSFDSFQLSEMTFWCWQIFSRKWLICLFEG